MNLLRTFLCSKWTENVGKELNSYCADSITKCTKTTGNTLSVWTSSTTDFKTQEVKDLIVAFASSMERPDSIDFIWLNETELTERGICIEETDGVTKYESMKDKHRDLAQLDYEKLGIVSEHIVSQMKIESNFQRVTKGALVQMTVDISLADDNDFSVNNLKDGWKKHIIKEFENRELASPY